MKINKTFWAQCTYLDFFAKKKFDRLIRMFRDLKKMNGDIVPLKNTSAMPRKERENSGPSDSTMRSRQDITSSSSELLDGMVTETYYLYIYICI